MPFEAARTRRALAETGAGVDPAAAETAARIALSVFERLGAAGEADAMAAWLRRTGVRVARVTNPRGSSLTKREREVLGLVGEGLSNPAIAERLFLSRRTVENHVASILSKLGANSRTEAAALTSRAANR